MPHIQPSTEKRIQNWRILLFQQGTEGGSRKGWKEKDAGFQEAQTPGLQRLPLTMLTSDMPVLRLEDVTSTFTVFHMIKTSLIKNKVRHTLGYKAKVVKQDTRSLADFQLLSENCYSGDGRRSRAVLSKQNENTQPPPTHTHTTTHSLGNTEEKNREKKWLRRRNKGSMVQNRSLSRRVHTVSFYSPK